MLDRIEEMAMKFAGKCYLLVAISALGYILWRAPMDICIAVAIAIVAFVFYCILDPDELAPEYKDDDKDNQ